MSSSLPYIFDDQIYYNIVFTIVQISVFSYFYVLCFYLFNNKNYIYILIISFTVFFYRFMSKFEFSYKIANYRYDMYDIIFVFIFPIIISLLTYVNSKTESRFSE